MTPDAYLDKLRTLLDAEHECERSEFVSQQSKRSIYEKVLRGTCWFPLEVVRTYYNALNQFVAEVRRMDGRGEEHQFDHGKPVCFFAATGEGRTADFSWSGTVSYVDEDSMGIVLPSESNAPQLHAASQLGVQLYFDETPYRLMVEALTRAREDSSGRLAEFKEIFHGTRQCAVSHLAQMSFPWLNKSQEEAVNMILAARDVAIVHGPPGTGKTTTLVEAVCETLRRETQVLVCAQSNMAVDWVSQQLVERGVSVLRIGNPTRVGGKMLGYTFERRFEEHPDYPLLWRVRRSIRELRSSARKGESVRAKLASLRDKAAELETRITASLFASTMVVASTLTGAASRLLAGMKFPTLFIDEAAQALEPACWIPLRRCDRIVMCGDHQQLPPTVKSQEAAHGGLGRTLMEAVVQRHPECVSLLRTQYRMNDAIMTFPSRWFYNGMLKSAPAVADRRIFPLDSPVEWLDTSDGDSSETVTAGGKGKMNEAEASVVIEALKRYLATLSRTRVEEGNIDFAVISPYKSQVRLLRAMVGGDPSLKPFRRRITVNTVDGFQGQERDAVFISLVRSNDGGNIGFLADLRRMNVAMTRARMKLVIVGDASTLTRHRFYAALHAYVLALDGGAAGNAPALTAQGAG